MFSNLSWTCLSLCEKSEVLVKVVVVAVFWEGLANPLNLASLSLQNCFHSAAVCLSVPNKYKHSFCAPLSTVLSTFVGFPHLIFFFPSGDERQTSRSFLPSFVPFYSFTIIFPQYIPAIRCKVASNVFLSQQMCGQLKALHLPVGSLFQMLTISLCFWSPWFCSLKQTPSVPVSGLLPLLHYTEVFIPALCTIEFHPLLLCRTSASSRPPCVMFLVLCCAGDTIFMFQSCLWLSVPGACFASHHPVRIPLAPHTNVNTYKQQLDLVNFPHL